MFSLLVSIISISVYFCNATDDIYLKNENYTLTLNIYDSYKTESANVVFLGDSHIRNVNWSELMGNNQIVSRGIHGDIIPGVINRLYQVYSLHPPTCVVMVGVNDLYAHYSVSQVLANYQLLLSKLTQNKIIPIVCSTLFVCKTYQDSRSINEQVSQINQQLQKYCQEQNISFVDVNSSLSSNGFMKAEFSKDGIHCNATAYRIWRDQVATFCD